MVLINEWLPNPVGNDTSGEWLELFNGGNNSVNLDGWKIVSGSSKFSISGKNIGTNGFLLLPRSETKLVFKNTDGMVSLYDASGKLVSSASFLGSAPEGKSFGRVQNGGGFVWSEPTPGAANIISSSTAIIENVYPVGVPLNKPLGTAEFLGLMLGVAIVLTGLVVFVFKKDHGLFKLFFGRDEEIR
jgi:hypothetical protein